MAAGLPTFLPALIGGIGSLFGRTGLNAQQQQQYNMQNRIAQNLYQQGTGVPGSSPQERAQLAEAHALLGAQQLQQQQNAMGALQRNMNPSALGDFYNNNISLQTAQRMAVDAQARLQNQQARQQALLQAAGVSRGAGSLAGQATQQNGLPQAFGALGSALGYYYGMKQNGLARPPSPGVSPEANADADTTGKAIQAQQGPLGENQPANMVGGFNSTFNQYRQSGGLTGPSAPLNRNPWLSAWMPDEQRRLASGVNY